MPVTLQAAPAQLPFDVARFALCKGVVLLAALVSPSRTANFVSSVLKTQSQIRGRYETLRDVLCHRQLGVPGPFLLLSRWVGRWNGEFIQHRPSVAVHQHPDGHFVGGLRLKKVGRTGAAKLFVATLAVPGLLAGGGLLLIIALFSNNPAAFR
jgi:hypothetical protein